MKPFQRHRHILCHRQKIVEHPGERLAARVSEGVSNVDAEKLVINLVKGISDREGIF